jgi:V-type H+-transporting ATPase subunit C
MPDPQKYLLLSLPTSIAPSNSEEDALNVIQATTTTDIGGFVTQFKVPHFKIGTLDALVGQADDLAKLEQAAEGVVAKIGDTLRIILDGDVEKIDQQKVVLDSESPFATPAGPR